MGYDPHKRVAELQAKVWKLENQLRVAVDLLVDVGRGAEVRAAMENAGPFFQEPSVWEGILSNVLYAGNSSGFAELDAMYGVQVQAVNYQPDHAGRTEVELIACHPESRTTYRVLAGVALDKVVVTDISTSHEIR